MASNGPLEIGCASIWEDEFRGRIDEVRIYDRALTAEELESLPAVRTTEAYGADPTEAVLGGNVNPRNTETTYYFEYGTTPAYGSRAPDVSEDVVTGDEVREVEEVIDDLQPETTYHYRIVATNAAGTVVGRDQTLTTGTAVSSPQELAAQRDALLAETNWQGFVNVHWSGDTLETAEASTMNVIQGSGAKMLRISIEEVKEVKAKQNYDAIFKLAAERGITLLPILIGDPERNDSLIPQDDKGDNIRSAWRTEVRDIVKRYGHNGDFWKEHPGLPSREPDYWEIWNEQNYGASGSVKGGKIIPAEYGDLLEESNNVIEGVDPTAKILFGGLLTVGRNNGPIDKMSVGEFIRRTGHPQAYDALSLHPYAFQAPGKNRKERAPTNADDVQVITKKIRRNIKGPRFALDQTGGENKRIWITELGWPVKMPGLTPNDGSHLPVSEEIQRDLLNSTFNMIKRHSGKAQESFDIAKVFYYNVEDATGKAIWNDWAFRSGLREDEDYKKKDYGQPGRFRKSWFAFQNQADFAGKFP
jgi:hypothetical protein